MIDIHFEIDGKRVSPNKIGDALEKSILQEITNQIKASLQAVRCEEHGQYPKVTIKGRNLDNLSFEISGCCDSLVSKASSKLD